MTKINIKMLNTDALNHLKKNAKTIAQFVIDNPTNAWIYKEFPQPMFNEKNLFIDDFVLQDNLDSSDKKLDFENSITIYNCLKHLPRYILTDECFWLWLYLDKFYSQVRGMMKVNGPSTILDHWCFNQGRRRGLMFGVLSRCYFRVALTIDESNKLDNYYLTRWVIENPERFRNLTWRSYSSETHIVKGTIKGEMKAIKENPSIESEIDYPAIAKYISSLGSVMLLDMISEEDIESLVYNKIVNK